MKLIRIILTVFLIGVFFSGAGVAKYYQYTDEEGNLCFTDDRGQIPDKQQKAVKNFESVETRPQSDMTRRKTSPASDRRTAADANTLDGQLQITAEQLDAEKEALDQKFQELEKEKAAVLENSAEDMSPNELSAYKDRIHEINERIEQYDKSREAFQKKVDRFNTRIKQKKEKEAAGGQE